MARPRRKPKAAAEDLDAMRDGRRCGRFPEWWDNYSPAELKVMQDRGRALVEGRRIDWIDWGKPL